jgi:hypothetical protein
VHDHDLRIGALRKNDGRGAFLHLALDRDSHTWGFGIIPSISFASDTGTSANLEINFGPWVATGEIGALFGYRDESERDVMLDTAFPSQSTV